MDFFFAFTFGLAYLFLIYVATPYLLYLFSPSRGDRYPLSQLGYTKFFSRGVGYTVNEMQSYIRRFVSPAQNPKNGSTKVDHFQIDSKLELYRHAMRVKAGLVLLYGLGLIGIAYVFDVALVSRGFALLVYIFVAMYVALGLYENYLQIKLTRLFQVDYYYRYEPVYEQGSDRFDIDKGYEFYRTSVLSAPVTVFKCWAFVIAISLSVLCVPFIE